MGVFSKPLEPITRQTEKTPRTRQKNLKNPMFFSKFHFLGLLKQQKRPKIILTGRRTYRITFKISQKHPVQQNLQFSLGFFLFFGRSGAFFFLVGQGARRLKKNEKTATSEGGKRGKGQKPFVKMRFLVACFRFWAPKKLKRNSDARLTKGELPHTF